jgi:hypothetical protein
VSIRVVTSPVSFVWDAGPAYLAAGTLLDVPPGGALESAIGAGNLITPADPAAAAVNVGVSN